MKNRKFFRRFLSLAMALVMTMALVAPSFASTGNYGYPTSVSPALSATPTMPIWSTTDKGVSLSVNGYAIITQWDTAGGCALHGQFDGDCLMRRLRLTFNDAYQLLDSYNYAAAANSANISISTYFPAYGRLSDYMSTYTFQSYCGVTAYATLQNLKASYEYQTNWAVRGIVDQQLLTFNGHYADGLRSGLAQFMPAAVLNGLDFPQLLDLSKTIINTPAYIEFHNTLHGHDCSTVRSLLNNGYSLTYVAQLYTNTAAAAVQQIWPDYQQRMATYYQNHGSW